MSELARNRETLMRVRGNVGVVSGTLDEARAILRSEWRGGGRRARACAPDAPFLFY